MGHRWGGGTAAARAPLALGTRPGRPVRHPGHLHLRLDPADRRKAPPARPGDHRRKTPGVPGPARRPSRRILTPGLLDDFRTDVFRGGRRQVIVETGRRPATASYRCLAGRPVRAAGWPRRLGHIGQVVGRSSRDSRGITSVGVLPRRARNRQVDNRHVPRVRVMRHPRGTRTRLMLPLVSRALGNGQPRVAGQRRVPLGAGAPQVDSAPPGLVELGVLAGPAEPGLHAEPWPSIVWRLVRHETQDIASLGSEVRAA